MASIAKLRGNGVVWRIPVLTHVGSKRVPTVTFKMEGVGELISFAWMIMQDGIRGTVIGDTMLWEES